MKLKFFCLLRDLLGVIGNVIWKWDEKVEEYIYKKEREKLPQKESDLCKYFSQETIDSVLNVDVKKLFPDMDRQDGRKIVFRKGSFNDLIEMPQEDENVISPDCVEKAIEFLKSDCIVPDFRMEVDFAHLTQEALQNTEDEEKEKLK